jgi:hypothetical protein
MEPNEKAEFYAVAPHKCPACGGTFKDYNAESAVNSPSGSLGQASTFMVHLFICSWCRKKVFAPPLSKG